jgi:hypothetical protein
MQLLALVVRGLSALAPHLGLNGLAIPWLALS